MKIHQYIEAHLISRPDAIAVRFKQSQSTYGELHAHSNQLACYLNSLGVSDEDRVVVCLEPSLEIAVSLLAIFTANTDQTRHKSNKLKVLSRKDYIWQHIR